MGHVEEKAEAKKEEEEEEEHDVPERGRW